MPEARRYFVQVRMPKSLHRSFALPVDIYRREKGGVYSIAPGSFSVDIQCLPELSTALQWALQRAIEQHVIRSRNVGEHGGGDGVA